MILSHEVERLIKIDNKTPHESTWSPILWATKLLTRAQIEGKIKVEAPLYANLFDEFKTIESANRKILNYGWVNFPLAYSQLATISVNFYFLASLLGRQYLIPCKTTDVTEFFPALNVSFAYDGSPYENHTPDFYIPFFTLIEIFCYFGWIKMAETLLNPFGNDDDNFQMNFLIDRNLQVRTYKYK